ncbi:UDP-glucose 4-epimerase-like [Oppia nitens]|uniref:UDP-glucose 4-epimerase-like n=1 Tax=Oppia nitens TaxID=1686743 RepID=UPI0023D9ADC7|nr:UDP-glucose 4-epimerase-like [Oppia nitens]
MCRLVLVTGAAGYIGSHCVLNLLSNNYEVVVIDNSSTSALINGQQLPESLRRVELLANNCVKEFIFGDLCNSDVINKMFKKYRFDAVVHLADLKNITESIEQPLDYYRNNMISIINLLDAMKRFEVFNLIFASSAVVYGKPKYLPLDELHPTGQSLTSSYAKSLYMTEQILQDLCTTDPKWTVVSLRMFNVVGAHNSADIGEHTTGVPKNLMPYITQVANEGRPELRVYGSDYDTPDGTGIRDYIHVEDVCDLILKALNKIISDNWSQWYAFNVANGSGHSVLEIIDIFEKKLAQKIPYVLVDRRPGDIGHSLADISLSKQIFNWEPKRDIHLMCESAMNWQKKHINGFDCIHQNVNQ